MPGKSAGRRHTVLATAIVLLLLTDVGMLWLRQGPAPLTEDVVLDRYRSQAAADDQASPTPVPDPGTEPEVPAPTASSAAPAETAPAEATPAPAQPTAGPAGSPNAEPPTAPPDDSPEVGRPAEGVYAYRTTGYERVAAFGGSRHDYPETTYLTVRGKGCGTTLRWQPLEERWDESDHCLDGNDLTIERFAMYHEFFRQGEEQVYPCDDDARVYRHGAAVGTTWTWRCAGEHGEILTHTRVMGTERVNVGGTDVEAVHLRYESDISGSTRGIQVQERWIDPVSGHLVRIVSDADVHTATPLGETHYEEHYRIDLLSLQPRR